MSPHLRSRLLDMLRVARDAAFRWSDDHAAQLGAALAYYAIFAVGPLLLIAISVSGLVFGRDAAQHQIVGTLQSFIGASGAETIRAIVEQSAKPSSGIMGTIAGVVLLLFGATGLFGQLDDALNLIWRVPPSKRPGWILLLRQRFLSLTMVMGTSFLLLVSLIVSTLLTVVGQVFSERLPGGALLWHGINLCLSLVVSGGVFALIFKILPRGLKLEWSDVWRGALVTALLFTLGKFLLTLYIEKGQVGSPYGAAGSLIGVLVWIYYASQILFFGAEITQVYAERFGSRAPGRENAPVAAT